MNSDKFIYAVCIIVVSISGLMAGEARLLSHEVYSVMTNNVRTEFYALEKGVFKKRVDYRLKVLAPRTSYWYDNGSSKVILKGKALAFSDRYSLHDLAAGLWDLLDTPKHGFDASVILYAKAGTCFMGVSGKMYLGVPDQCRLAVRSAIGEPEWWYPHPVLFDRGRVLSESKTNATLRAAHIGAMVKALADPAIRRGNPLEVDNILGALSVLNAREAADTFVSYAFYNYKTGSDFRRVQAQTNNLYDVYEITIPITTYIPRLGNDVLPRVLNRFSSATLEEQEIGLGGGAAPALAVLYFVQLGATEAEAVKYIDSYIKYNEMSSEQVGALRKIREAVVFKKYRPEWLSRSGRPSVRTWAE